MTERRKIVTEGPENSETPLDAIRSWVTPNRLFFVRNHFPVPEVLVDNWSLHVDGGVERPKAWTWDELTALPERTVFATVECAGNGRSFLEPHQHGVQWGAGAIGHAEWTGVPLRLVLERAGLKPDVKEVLFEGLDRGTEAGQPEPMNFARSLPIAKALDPDTLLVYRMNGELLEPIHGYPLRLFVPGWYGVASVKWLSRISAINHAFKGYYQSKKYTVQRRTTWGQETEIIGPMAVKAEIIRPLDGAQLGLGMNRLFGVAWAGEDAVAAVEISTDSGHTWSRAELMGPQAKYSWTLWEYLWEVGTAGSYALLARAVSTSGKVQPLRHDPLNGGYLIHHSRPTRVQVAGARWTPPQPIDLQSISYDMNAFAEQNYRLQLDVELEFVGGEGI